MAEVSLGDVTDVDAESLDQRLVEMQLRAQARHRRGVGVLANHRLYRVARHHLQDQESDDEDAEQCRDREKKATKNERGHGVFVIDTSVHRWPLKITGGSNPLIQGCTAYRSL